MVRSWSEAKKGEHARMRSQRTVQIWHRPTRRDKAPETSKVWLADVMHNGTFEPGARVQTGGMMPPPLPPILRREREIVSSSISSICCCSTSPHLLAQASPCPPAQVPCSWVRCGFAWATAVFHYYRLPFAPRIFSASLLMLCVVSARISIGTDADNFGGYTAG